MRCVRERQERELSSLFAHRVIAEMFLKNSFQERKFQLAHLKCILLVRCQGRLYDSKQRRTMTMLVFVMVSSDCKRREFMGSCCQGGILQFGGCSSCPTQEMLIYKYVAAIPVV